MDRCKLTDRRCKSCSCRVGVLWKQIVVIVGPGNWEIRICANSICRYAAMPLCMPKLGILEAASFIFIHPPANADGSGHMTADQDLET